MAFTWVRPADMTVLAGRPLLDVGTGDGQTLAGLGIDGLGVIGIDASPAALRSGTGRRQILRVAGSAIALPVADAAAGVVLAADLLHHLEDAALSRALAETRRVLRDGGFLVAWWYGEPGRGGTGSPKHPRPAEAIVAAAAAAGFSSAAELALDVVLEGGPRTVGLLARR